MTLVPQGDVLRVQMSVMDGQYEMSGMAAKQLPGAPAPQRGGGGFGGGRGPQTNENTDFAPKPPYKPRTAAEEAKGFILPQGYRMELIASDPDVISPGVIEFDGNGRMYVSELVSYMMDAEGTREHDPISRISRWESTKGDGVYDKRTVFADKLVAPRMILPLTDGVILTSETDSDDIIKLSDTNGDGVADKREVAFTGIGQSGDANIEHQKAGLLWNMDNWIYTTYNAFRIRWTPAGFLRESTAPNGGQWGLASDDDGKPWFVDAGGERGPMNFQYPIHYGSFTPCPSSAGARGGRRGAAPAPPHHRPPAPPGMGAAEGRRRRPAFRRHAGRHLPHAHPRSLNHRRRRVRRSSRRRAPGDLKGDLLFTEPVGPDPPPRLENIEGLTRRGRYPQSDSSTARSAVRRRIKRAGRPLYIADVPTASSGAGWSRSGGICARRSGSISSTRWWGRPHLASALRRPSRRRKTDTNISQPAIRRSRRSSRRRMRRDARRSSSRISRIRTAGGATRRSGAS
jgi:hypothetical protein